MNDETLECANCRAELDMAEHDAEVEARVREEIAQAFETSTEGLVQAYDAEWITVSDAAAIARGGAR